MRNLLVLCALEIKASLSKMLFFSLCLSMGVAAVSAVFVFNLQMKQTIKQNSRVILGADVEIQDVRELPSSLIDGVLATGGIDKAVRLSRLVAMARRFNNPASSENTNVESKNIELLAVEDAYPLLPEAYKTEPRDGFALLHAGQDAALVDSSLATMLGLASGDLIEISGVVFRVVGLVTDELSADMSSLFFGPKVIVKRQTAKEKGLLGKTTRLRDMVLLTLRRGDGRSPENFVKNLEQQFLWAKTVPSLKVRSHEDDRATSRSSMRNLDFFLSQVSLATLLLTCLGVATGLAEYIRSRRIDVAVYRAMGATPRTPTVILASLVICICLVGVIFGVFVSEVLRQSLLLPLFNQFFSLPIAELSWQNFPYLVVLSGFFLPLAFLFPMLQGLEKVSPNVVLQENSSSKHVGKLTYVVCWALALALLVWLFASSSPKWWTGCLLLLVNMALFAFFFAFVHGLLFIFERSENRLPLALRLSFGEIKSRQVTSVLCVSLIGISVFLIALVQFLKTDIVSSLSADLSSARKPNLFFIDVQPHQSDTLARLLTKLSGAAPDVAPMARARLTLLNDSPISGKSDDAEADRMRQREQNLTWYNNEGGEEKVIEALPENLALWEDGKGQRYLWQKDNLPEVSLEQRFASRIGAKLGDWLTFDLAGVELKAKVTSLRKVNWQSFRPNFFIVVKPMAMQGAPHQVLMTTYGESVEKRKNIQNMVLNQYPNVSIIDATNILRRVQELASVIGSVARGLAYLLLIAGLFIMISGLFATRDARLRNAAILRSLGATGATLRWALLFEFLLLGTLSAAMGVFAAMGLAALFTTYVLELDAGFNLAIGLYLWLGAVAITCLAGYFSCRTVLRVKPAVVLREVV